MAEKKLTTEDPELTVVLDKTMTGMHGDQWTEMSKAEKGLHLRPLISLTFHLTGAVLEQVDAKIDAANPDEAATDAELPEFVVPDTLQGLAP